MVENLIRSLAKEYCPEYRMEYIESIAYSLDLVNIGKGIIPTLRTAAMKEETMRFLELGDSMTNREAYITAVYCKEKASAKKEHLIQMFLNEIDR